MLKEVDILRSVTSHESAL